MENFKKVVYNLKEEVVALQKRIDVLEGRPSLETNSAIHYVSSNMESGIHPLDDFDTWRFACRENVPYPNPSNINIRKYTLYILNPTLEFIETFDILKKNYPYIEFNSNATCIDNIQDDYSIVASNGGSYGSIPQIYEKDLRKLLDSKVWEINKIDNAKNTLPRFKRTIEIDFKNKYKIPPHISCYVLSDPEKYNISYRIKDITSNKVIIELFYANEYYSNFQNVNDYFNTIKANKTFEPIIPETTTLHWQVSGIIEETKQEDLLNIIQTIEKKYNPFDNHVSFNIEETKQEPI
jgi:hypothetical protein